MKNQTDTFSQLLQKLSDQELKNLLHIFETQPELFPTFQKQVIEKYEALHGNMRGVDKVNKLQGVIGDEKTRLHQAMESLAEEIKQREIANLHKSISDKHRP